ncbi:MAG: helix-turn-helix transcriptional regulator [Myxococcota bacterium]
MQPRVTRLVHVGPTFRPLELPGQSGLLVVQRGRVELGNRTLEAGSIATFCRPAALASRSVGSRAVAFFFETPLPADALVLSGVMQNDPVLKKIAPLLQSEQTSPEVSVPLVIAFVERVRELSAPTRQGMDTVGMDSVVRRAIVRANDSRVLPSVPELARQVGVSRASLVRRFRAAVGESPSRYLTGLRLREAARRLLVTDDGLAAIAADAGYSSEFAFSRAFKRRYGVAPGRYRQGSRTSLRMCA